MPDFETLQADAKRLIGQEPMALPEIRKLMVEMDDYFTSPDFQGLEREQRGVLQGLYKELRIRVRGPEAAPAPASGTAGGSASNAINGAAFVIPGEESTLKNPPKAR